MSAAGLPIEERCRWLAQSVGAIDAAAAERSSLASRSVPAFAHR
jgi:hypothetical protein